MAGFQVESISPGGGGEGVIIRHDVHIASHPLLSWSTESDEHVALARPTLASLTSLPLFSLFCRCDVLFKSLPTAEEGFV
ncbi:hypothetical protein GW17_00023201 [Ensete ventricosum]|nr:hypothetical protein GW17_00023201 [Ensete ventricosum]